LVMGRPEEWGGEVSEKIAWVDGDLVHGVLLSGGLRGGVGLV
jgi:hypothetical protein